MINIKNKQNIFAAIILSASTVSFSKDISYDYIQGTYTSLSVDTNTSAGNLTADGFGVSGSFSIAPVISITAGYEKTGSERTQNIEVNTTELNFGITIHHSVANSMDIFGNFSILKGNVEANNNLVTVEDDDTGSILSIGLHYSATDKIELEAEFSRVDVFNDTSNTIGVGGRFYTQDKLSLGIGFSTGNDVDILELNVRLDFK